MNEGKRWQTVKQTAHEHFISSEYVRHLYDKGELKGMRVPGGPRLIDKADSKRWGEQRKAKPNGQK